MYLWPCGLRWSPLLRHHVTERTDFSSSKLGRSAPRDAEVVVALTELTAVQAGTFPRKGPSPASQSRTGAGDDRFPNGRMAKQGPQAVHRRVPVSFAGRVCAHRTSGQIRPALAGQAAGTQSTQIRASNDPSIRVRPCTTIRWNGPGSGVFAALRARVESLRALRSAWHHGPGRSPRRCTSGLVAYDGRPC